MTISRIAAGGRTPPELRRARLATAPLFFANGCGLVALTVGLMILGTGALQRRPAAAVALAG